MKNASAQTAQKVRMPSTVEEARALAAVAFCTAAEQPETSVERRLLLALSRAAEDVVVKFSRLEQARDSVIRRLEGLGKRMAREQLNASINSLGELGAASDAKDFDRLCTELDAAKRALDVMIGLANKA